MCRPCRGWGVGARKPEAADLAAGASIILTSGYRCVVPPGQVDGGCERSMTGSFAGFSRPFRMRNFGGMLPRRRRARSWQIGTFCPGLLSCPFGTGIESPLVLGFLSCPCGTRANGREVWVRSTPVVLGYVATSAPGHSTRLPVSACVLVRYPRVFLLAGRLAAILNLGDTSSETSNVSCSAAVGGCIAVCGLQV